MKTEHKIADKKHLLEFLEKKGILVTANRRMARSTLEWYGKSQVKKGRSAWETPEILTLGAWMERCTLLSLYPDISPGPQPEKNKKAGDAFTTVPSGAVLLSQVQERMVWEEIIETSAHEGQLFSASSAAVRASTAWALAHEWDIPVKGGLLWESGDPAALLNWAGQFDRRCMANGWIDHARLSLILAESFKSGRMAPPGAICLYGFDEFSPAQSRLFGILADCGTKVSVYEPKTPGGRAMQAGFPDAATELFSVAGWARSAIESGPDLRVGVIVFDLEERRNEVMRIFEDVCHPDSALLASGHQNHAFNLSYGRTLSNYPLVRAALLILSLGKDRFSITDWSELLRSPFLAQATTENHGYAAMDAYLRKRGGKFVTIRRFLEIFYKNAKKKWAPAFKNCLEKFTAIVSHFPARQSPSKWAAAFTNMTKAFGWPGDRTGDSHEYQIAIAWQDTILQFGELDRVVSSGWRFEKALSCFKQLVLSTIFQPEQPDAPIQIMGFLEAAGEAFDRLWITGLHHERWPSPARPDPFLPLGLQREKNLPHCSPERELSYAKKITERLLESAPQIYVSYPVSDGENKLFPSPLVAGLPEFFKEDVIGANTYDYGSVLLASAATDAVCDQKGPPVVQGEKVGGGTGVIKDQAACPFKAFAHYRLGATEIESPAPGLNAAERGILVHASLEHAWGLLKDQKTLLSIKDEEIEKLVRKAVSSAISTMSEKRPDLFSGRFEKIESIRLFHLLFECLALEKNRFPFAVIAREQAMEIEIAGLRLATVVDRIDRLDDGRIVIIDYKTSKPEVKSWTDERMAEPQLPLYSTVMKEPLAGVFFLQVRKGECRYKGVAADDNVIPGAMVINGENNKRFSSDKQTYTSDGKYDDESPYTSIEALVQEWEKRLGVLAAEVLAGHAPVAPASPARDCRYCDLKPLCRI